MVAEASFPSHRTERPAYDPAVEIVVALAVGAAAVCVAAVAISMAGHARQRSGRPRWSRTTAILFLVLVGVILAPIAYALSRVAAAFAELR